MRIITTKATKLSNVTIDEDLDMGTAGFDILLGAKALKTTNLQFKELNSTAMTIRNLADNDYRDFATRHLFPYGNIQAAADAAALAPPNVDNNYLLIRARDNDNALAEIARLVGAADPYFQMTLPMRLSPCSVPGTPVEGHFWYDATADKLRIRDAALTQNIPVIKSGTYDGNDGDDRQITTGFQCALVIITDLAARTWIAIATTDSTLFDTTPTVLPSAVDVLLHASDGFVVDSANANASGTTYTYVAISV